MSQGQLLRRSKEQEGPSRSQRSILLQQTVALPLCPDRPVELKQIGTAGVPSAAMHAADQLQRRRVDVAALFVLNRGLDDMSAKDTAYDRRLARSGHE